MGATHTTRTKPENLSGSLGAFAATAPGASLPRLVLPEPSGDPVWRLALFGGLHGDEPASVHALYRFLDVMADHPEERRHYELTVYPNCNPTGWAAGTRENGVGLDLNRHFWAGSDQPEVLLLEGELRRQPWDGLIILHADDTSDGLYGFAFGQLLNEQLLRPALEAAGVVVPVNPAGQIDGFEALGGVLHRCYEGVLAAPPEARPRPFEIVFETPGRAPLEEQVEAAVQALRSILVTYRNLMSFAQNL